MSDTTGALRWRSEFAAHIIDGEAAYLVSDGDVVVLEGLVLAAIAPLLDGIRTGDDIVTHLEGQVPEVVVRAVLDALAQRSLTTTDPAVTTPEAAFFEALGLPGTETATRLAATGVRLVGLNALATDALSAALDAAGLVVLGDHDESADEQWAVVLVDDYLDPALRGLNGDQIARGEPWMMARLQGTTVWTGPFMAPGDTACWECLAHRLEANRRGHVYLGERLSLGAPARGPAIAHPLSASIAASRLAALSARVITTRGAGQFIQSDDLATGESRRHVVTRRPQCPVCGDPRLQSRRGSTPVPFASRAKVDFQSGGARAVSASQFLGDFGDLVSPVTGVAPMLLEVDMPDDLLHLVISGSNAARRPRTLEGLHMGLRSTSCGKGVSQRQARASALGEAIERHSAVYQGDEERRAGSLRSLGDDAIDPRSCSLFSPRQYELRDYWNLGASQFNYVFEPFDEDAPMSWSPLWSLSTGRQRWLPTQYLYYGFDEGDEPPCAVADSNGCAAGTSYEDAALQGLCELVERDAVALWWYNRVRRPGVDLDSLKDPYIDRMREIYQRLGREIWALDLTSDIGIPVVGAFSRSTGTKDEDILIAFGAHLDPGTAILRALTEMNQFLPGVLRGEHDEPPTYSGDAAFSSWCASARLETHAYLAPTDNEPARHARTWPSLVSDDLGEDWARGRAAVESRGLEVLVLDQTRADIELPVVKIVVPGMRHFWPRFAPGRLYDVPVSLGWLESPTSELDLNPVGVFI